MTVTTEEELRAQLGATIRKARERRFESVQAALQASGVNRATWLRIEKGEKVRDDRLIAAEKALDWPPGTALDYLRGESVSIDLNPDGSVASVIVGSEAPYRFEPAGGLDLPALNRKVEELYARLAALESRVPADEMSRRRETRKKSDAPPIPDDVAAADPKVPSQGDRVREDQDAGYDIDQDRGV